MGLRRDTKCVCTHRWKIREGFLEEVPFELGLEGCVQICEVDSEGRDAPGRMHNLCKN